MASNEQYSTFTLHIEGLNIEAVPLADIGQYIADLAELLGKDVEPRFAGVSRGSINLKAKVQRDREFDVKNRAFLLRIGDAPEEALRAKQRLAGRLGKHRARKATLLDETQAKVYEIPIERPNDAPDIPPLHQNGTVHGQVIRVGGRQDIVPVDIQDVDGHVYACRAPREMARLLAKEIFSNIVRAYGSGRLRYEGNLWRLDDFTIERFELLEDEPLGSVLNEIRALKSSWKELENPLAELEQIRHGE